MLWASTGSKNPSYRDVMYIEPLIGDQTVSTMPEKTSAAFLDHGVVEDTLERGVDEARETLNELERLGGDFRQIATQLENEGIQKFVEPYEEVLAHIEHERQRALGTAA